MKRRAIWMVLTCLMVMSLVLASCATSATTSTTTPITTTTTTTKTAPPTTATTTAPTTTPTTTAATGNWWDSLGKPQYGGEMVLRYAANIGSFDPCFPNGFPSIKSGWMEKLHTDDWTLDPAVFGYSTNFHPYQYVKGSLAETWEFTDSSTYVVHLRKGIRWQDIPPANGREFTADDVVFHYDRLYGLGGGYTVPSPTLSTRVAFQNLQSVTATDKYTVVFKWKKPNPEFIMETIQAPNVDQCLENSDAVKQWGDVTDWHHAIGTGPFILQDFVSASSATMVKNPNYWGYDEHYPQNHLPYIDKLTILIIPDNATALAALRTGKIDAIDNMSLNDTKSVQKSNPEILQVTIPQTTTSTVDPRNDLKPFNDIRVREAMQMAIDLTTIAKSYYSGTADPSPSTLTSNYMTGWGYPYSQWPQDLKDQYAYNPTKAKQLLSEAGYPNGFKTDVVADNRADLDLLQVVKSYFAQVNIDMEIRPIDAATFTTFVMVGHKNDALAYRLTGALGVTYEPTMQLSKFLTAGTSNPPNVSDPIFDAFYPKGMAATTVDEVQQTLRDADKYVAQQHFVISLLQPNLFGLYQPWLKGYHGQNGAISGTDQGANYLNFYPARWWIDQNLKKSLGH